ncbi:MAG: hypothetical protein EXS36_02470 [Pedosphaera sp.]|nr:hypothetical protein [Pedosphaera sp.]
MEDDWGRDDGVLRSDDGDVFVTNPFGRAAMKQGDKSAVTVKHGETLRLRFGAVIHEGLEFDSTNAIRTYLESTQGWAGR